MGLFDASENRGQVIAKELKTRAYDSMEELLNDSDAVSVATPAFSHYNIAKEALNRSCHVFMEKPFTTSVEDAEDLIKLSQKAGLLIQVGHIERFNPALTAFINKHNTCNPDFIETHRLAPFNIRGTDTDVVLDLMIHDIDLILN